MDISDNEKAANTKLLIKAAEDGNLSEIQRLIPIASPKTQNSSALTWVVNKNNVEGVKLLAGVCDVNIPLSCAAEWNRVECLKVLIPFATEEEKVFAAGDAAFLGQMDSLKLLVAHCDPKGHNSFPLQMAAMGNYCEAMVYLLTVSNPADALHELRDRGDIEECCVLEQLFAQQQKTTIAQHVGGGVDKVRKL